MKAILALIAAAIVLLGAVLWGAPPSGLEGTWLGKTEVPDVGLVTVTLVLAKTETGLKGTISDDMGVIGKDVPILEATLDGDKLSFHFPLADSAMVTISVKVEEAKLTGGWVHEQGGSGAIAFERKK